MNNKIGMEELEYGVCIRCYTYNQSAYILDALNSFVIQKTSFPYVIIVVDDASTDGTRRVISDFVCTQFDIKDSSIAYQKETEHANIIYARHVSNKNCYIASVFLKRNLYKEASLKSDIVDEWRNKSKYEALCEGDDWWLTENKLQTQYDTLEEHLEVDMCACGTICYRDGKAIKEISPSSTNRTLTVNETILGGGGFLGTNSLMCRVSLLHDNFQFWRFFRLDYFLQIHGALRGGIFYLSDCMSAYRLSSNGSWTKTFKKNYNYWYFHRRKVIYTLELLNIETNYIHKQIIDQKISELYIGLFNFGFKSSVFHDAIKQMSLSRKIAYIINVCYGLLRR